MCLDEGIDHELPCTESIYREPSPVSISEYGVSVGDQFYYWGTFKVLASNKVVSTFQEFQNLKLKADESIRFEFDDNYAHRFDTERHPNIHESMRNGYQFVYTNKETPSFYRESNRNNTKSSRSKPHPKHKNKAQSKARRTNRKR